MIEDQEQFKFMYKRYRKMRTAIATGRHGLEQPFPVDPDNPERGMGTMKQLCEYIGFNLNYEKLVASLNKKATKLFYRSLPPEQADAARQLRKKELNRVRAARRRAKLAATRASISPTKLE